MFFKKVFKKLFKIKLEKIFKDFLTYNNSNEQRK